MITVLFFAHLQEITGQEKVLLPMANSSVKEIKAQLEQQYPNLSLQQVMAAINEAFATEDSLVQAGDTLAFIPPISGG